MNAHEYLRDRFSLNLEQPQMPIEIRGVKRDVLPSIFRDLGVFRVVEVGTLRGEFAKVLCEGNPALHLTCVDAWTAYPGFTDQTEQKKLDDCYAITRKRLAPYGCDLRKGFSVQMAAQYPDGYFDACYLDANHRFEYLVADLAAWVPKVRPGGIIAGHDYCNRHLGRGVDMRVVEAVHGWTTAYDIRPWYVLGRAKIRKHEVCDRMRSWLWVA